VISRQGRVSYIEGGGGGGVACSSSLALSFPAPKRVRCVRFSRPEGRGDPKRAELEIQVFGHDPDDRHVGHRRTGRGGFHRYFRKVRASCDVGMGATEPSGRQIGDATRTTTSAVKLQPWIGGMNGAGTGRPCRSSATGGASKNIFEPPHRRSPKRWGGRRHGAAIRAPSSRRRAGHPFVGPDQWPNSGIRHGTVLRREGTLRDR